MVQFLSSMNRWWKDDDDQTSTLQSPPTPAPSSPTRSEFSLPDVSDDFIHPATPAEIVVWAPRVCLRAKTVAHSAIFCPTCVLNCYPLPLIAPPAKPLLPFKKVLKAITAEKKAQRINNRPRPQNTFEKSLPTPSPSPSSSPSKQKASVTHPTPLLTPPPSPRITPAFPRAMPQTPIPDIPGVLLEDQETQYHLSRHVANLCGLSNNRFPGSQPVSFSNVSLDDLENMDFWVCEKSDGVRVLLFVVFNSNSGSQEVWLIDRKNRYFLIENLHFTHWERLDDPLEDTLLDGELVIDEDARGVQTLRFYAFDCLVLGGENIMKKPLVKRFARLREWVIQPRRKALQRYPEWRNKMPFEVVAKQQELSYCVGKVLEEQIPNLQHGHDGLIFTCAESEYVPGTDTRILKWKPPSENSIDFRIELCFPPGPDGEPDLYATPIFLLNQWAGGDKYEYFDEMDVDDDEWESWKKSGEQFDGRIVEVSWNEERQSWRKMRFRDDKPHANHKSIVSKILRSIEDGVEIEAVLSRSDAIRAAWKQREQQRKAGPQKRAPPPHLARRRSPPRNAAPATPQKGVVVGLKR